MAIADANGAILAVPHIYSAYAMVRHAARMVRNGDLGRIRFVAAEHASGWASAEVDQWRMDPAKGGVATAVADVGTHAFHLLRYITGLEATRISAELSTLVPGRPVFDNATMRLTLSNGAPATVWATMAATGHEHGLRIRVFGDDASLEWRHEDPQHLIVRDPDGGTTILAQGMSMLSDDAARLTRVGLGHPEGFLEAFANFYLDLADDLAGQPRPRTVHPHRRRRPHRCPVRRSHQSPRRPTTPHGWISEHQDRRAAEPPTLRFPNLLGWAYGPPAATPTETSTPTMTSTRWS